ncbi:MAG: hypothetical protein H6546_02770 [Chitinophagales bacterium]|nr:hypothetical protein [Chitinophagales bacterium]
MRANNLSRALMSIVSFATFGLFGRKSTKQQFQPAEYRDDETSPRPGFRKIKHRELTPKQRKARVRAKLARKARKKQYQVAKSRKLAA